MTLLEPRWEQPKPTPSEARDMSKKVSLTAAGNPTDAIEEVLSFLQKSHRGGGALFASFTPHGPLVPCHRMGLDCISVRLRKRTFAILATTDSD